MIPQDFIHLLLDRTDIVEVIDRHVPLKKKGANYSACCPFHSEKTPSFTVSPSKQFYHCFGCGAHGTAITFLMDYAGMGFIDAVRDLASHAGLRLPEESLATRGDDGHRDRLAEIMESASRFYRARLRGERRAVDYLKGRGLTGETAARFGLGYAPDDWQGLAGGVVDYDDKALEETGLVLANAGKRYDRFRGRIMFPIRNSRGRVIAFGGRVLGQGEPKYLNSPETDLFHKGREVYGLFENRRAIQESGRAIVVEGYMDVVMLAQHGVGNAIATLGTAVTAEQVAMVLRMVDEVIFAFDGDAAGRKAAWRALENTLTQLPDGKEARFLFLPDGEDPDSFVRAQGSVAFTALCAQAKPLSDFLFAELSAQVDVSSQEGRVRLFKLVEPYLKQLQRAPLLAGAMRRRLAAATGIGATHGEGQRTRADVAARQPRAMLPPPAQVILQAILHRPEALQKLPELPMNESMDISRLATIMSFMREHPELASPSILLEHFRDRPEEALLRAATAALLEWSDDHDFDSDLDGAWATLVEQATRAQTQAISGRKLSEISAEERARYTEALKAKKLDRLRNVKPGD